MESFSSHHTAEQSQPTLRSISISSAQAKSIREFIAVVGITLGPAVLAFNLFNFNVVKNGYYFKEPAQYGIAIGVFLIALAWVTKGWNAK